MDILENLKKFALTPAVAAIGEEGEMSYRDLEDRSEALAAYLIARYPGKQPLVLWGDKEHDMLTGALGAIKSGRPYAAIASHYPEKRIRQILSGCRPCAILAIGGGEIPAPGCDVLDRARLDGIIAECSGITVDPSHWVKPQDLVCLFYTSGSTGTPKGVCISRRNVEALVDWWAPYVQLKEKHPRILNFSPYTFSSSLGTLFIQIGVRGATMYAIDKELAADYQRLSDFIYRTNPHYFGCTPSFLDICLKDPGFSAMNLPAIEALCVGGEALPHRIALALLDRFPGMRVINGYGATETTIGTIACDVTREMALSDKPLPIGYTSFNSYVYIADEKGNRLPDGEVGELIIVSDMISEGYLNDPERTAAAFFTDENGTRGFHTRDLAWIEKDLVYYAGRADNMVKVGGYRVEIEEVERYLNQVGSVAECVVVPAQEDGRTVMLAAYVVLKPGIAPGVQAMIAIKKEMAARVQGYMIPQKIVFRDSLPRNSSDKIDRNMLREMSRIVRA